MLTKSVPFTFNRGGYYYFSRRVPADLKAHYTCDRIVQGLLTRSPSTARTRALVAAAKLDEYWSHLRMTDLDLVGKHLLKSPQAAMPPDTGEASLWLPEALSLYLKLRGQNKGKTFYKAAERACKYVVEAAGNKQLHEYTRADALAFRDHLISKGLAGSSVSRVFNSITAIFNFVVSEYAVEKGC